MPTDPFIFAFADNVDLPSPDAPDLVVMRWLQQRLGRAPSWWEILEFRAGLRERSRRRARWRWWTRFRHPIRPDRDGLVADFLRTWEGKLLLKWLDGSMVALMARLALPNPWEHFDGSHPRCVPVSRRSALREHFARGGDLPIREQAAAVLAYANWKLLRHLLLAPDGILEDAEFLSSTHAAAINAMTVEGVTEMCNRLKDARGSDARRRRVLRELNLVGTEAIRLWPGIARFCAEPPRGLWPPPDNKSLEDEPSAVAAAAAGAALVLCTPGTPAGGGPEH